MHFTNHTLFSSGFYLTLNRLRNIQTDTTNLFVISLHPNWADKIKHNHKQENLAGSVCLQRRTARVHLQSQTTNSSHDSTEINVSWIIAKLSHPLSFVRFSSRLNSGFAADNKTNKIVLISVTMEYLFCGIEAHNVLLSAWKLNSCFSSK